MAALVTHSQPVWMKYFHDACPEHCWEAGLICGLGPRVPFVVIGLHGGMIKRLLPVVRNKAFTACGQKPCWSDDIICALGSTTCLVPSGGAKAIQLVVMKHVGMMLLFVELVCCNGAYNDLGIKCGRSCLSDGKVSMCRASIQ